MHGVPIIGGGFTGVRAAGVPAAGDTDLPVTLATHVHLSGW